MGKYGTIRVSYKRCVSVFFGREGGGGGGGGEYPLGTGTRRIIKI